VERAVVAVGDGKNADFDHAPSDLANDDGLDQGRDSGGELSPLPGGMSEADDSRIDSLGCAADSFGYSDHEGDLYLYGHVHEQVDASFVMGDQALCVKQVPCERLQFHGQQLGKTVLFQLQHCQVIWSSPQFQD